jgi:hypothetical protein
MLEKIRSLATMPTEFDHMLGNGRKRRRRPHVVTVACVKLRGAA